MLEALRERLATFLQEHPVCVFATPGDGLGAAMPIRYRLLEGDAGRPSLALDCLIPRWVDVVYSLERNPSLVLIVLDIEAEKLRWLQYEGTGEIVVAPDWGRLPVGATCTTRPGDLFRVVRARPKRIELFDESQGWGPLESLDC